MASQGPAPKRPPPQGGLGMVLKAVALAAVALCVGAATGFLVERSGLARDVPAAAARR